MRVSIIVTSFNYAGYLARCLDSCLAQDLPRDELEVVLVDDASTDETRSIIQDYEHVPNFRALLKTSNEGVGAAANEGVRIARGGFVTRVDADDFVATRFAVELSEQLAREPDAFCVCCDYDLVDAFGKVLERRSARSHPISCGVMYRRDQLIEAGMYSAEWRHLEGEELRRRLGERYVVRYVDKALYSYVQHERNKTKQAAAMRAHQLRLDEIYGSP